MTQGSPSLALACGLALLGCSAEDGAPARTAEVDIVDRTVEGISTSQVSHISGTYAGCAARSGSWSLAITGNPQLPFSPLTVVTGDAACTLALTTIHTLSDGALTVNTTVTPGAQLALGSAWSTPKAFGNPLKFYANAMLSAVDAAAPFTIRLLLSSDPNPLTFTNNAGYAAVGSSGAAADVPAPDYTISVLGTTLAVSVDAAATVIAVTGNLVLTEGVQTGEHYLIYGGVLADAYIAIDAVWTDGSYASSKTMMATSIPGSSLLAIGETLPKVKSLIIGHTANGVASYQKFAITFAVPP
ncbi:MAG: hypothetical protein ABW252_15935 [Polyangiales bacterium]